MPGDFERTEQAWRQGDRPITAAGIRMAASRKIREETRLQAPPEQTWPITRAIRPVSSPHTLHMWNGDLHRPRPAAAGHETDGPAT